MKRKAKAPINRLTREQLKADGWGLIEKVERFAPPGIYRDLFGFGDFLAVDKDTVLLVQATTAHHTQDRIKKILSLPGNPLALWTASPGRRAEVWGWLKQAGKWTVRRVVITPEMQISYED